MKTIKYTIEIEMYERPMMEKMEISKKEFESHIKKLTEQCESSVGEECPMEFRKDEIHEYESYTHRVVIFKCGCCRTYLEKIECKEGYCFKK